MPATGEQRARLVSQPLQPLRLSPPALVVRQGGRIVPYTMTTDC